MFNPEKFIPEPEGEKRVQPESVPSRTEQASSEEERLELKNEFESGLDQDMEAVATVIRNFNEITKKAETPEQKKELNSLREKIARAAKRFLKIERNIILTGLLALGADYYVTHPDLETTKNGAGNVEYIHPDIETTHILNVLSGRESISLEEALSNFRGITRTRAEVADIELPDDFDTYDIDRMDNFLTSALNKKGIDAKPGEIKEYFYDFQYLKQMELPEHQAQEIYDLVWGIEQESGNPKVRFQTQGPSVFGIALSSGDTYRAHYNPLENTIYLPMDMFVEQDDGYQNLIAELSHAKQLKNDPFGFYFKAAGSALRIFSKGGFDMNRLSEAQQEEYDIPRSLEHEAHSTIEPELQKKYEKLTKIKGVKGERE